MSGEAKQTKSGWNGIRRAHAKALPPYHLFNVFEDYFVFDTTGCRFYKQDELTSDFLLLSQSLTIRDAAKNLIVPGKYGRNKVMAVKKEVIYLSMHELFYKVNSHIDIRAVKKSIEECDIKDVVMDIQLSLAENCNLACKYCYCAKNHDVSQSVMMTENITKGNLYQIIFNRCPIVNYLQISD